MGADDPAVTRVVVTAAGGRAFSAGGDIRALYELGRAGRHDEMLQFWRDEYPLNAMIKHYPKPYVALIDGIVMGGGVGVSVHGSHRVAGDRFAFAMPEVGIGFFPDVGATWFLPRMPGELGAYCALTGERLDAADARRARRSRRIASPRRGLPICSMRCAARCRSMRCSRAFAEPAGEGPSLRAQRAAIDRLFARRPGRGHPRGARCAKASGRRIGRRRRPPRSAPNRRLSLKIALAQMRRGATLSISTTCMRTEFRIVSRVMHGHDFYEGVRAVIVDKDNAPRWRPAALAEVTRRRGRAAFRAARRGRAGRCA